MEEKIYIDTTFERLKLASQKINYKEFEDCVFENCDFSYADMSNVVFLDCKFLDCNLAMLKLVNSNLKNVFFKNCKMLGIEFNLCNDFLFSVQFQDCVLDYCFFSDRKMLQTNFINCSLMEANFTNTNLNNSLFDNCNLEKAIFNNSELEKVDFCTATNYTIDPEYNNIKKAKFSSTGLLGLLEKYDIVVNG